MTCGITCVTVQCSVACTCIQDCGTHTEEHVSLRWTAWSGPALLGALVLLELSAPLIRIVRGFEGDKVLSG